MLLPRRTWREHTEKYGRKERLKYCMRCDAANDNPYSHDCKACAALAAEESTRKRLATRAANKAKGLHLGPEYYRTPEEISWRSAIGDLTRKAIRLGFLPKLDGSIPCADCGFRPAICYDHRDYSKPLDVAPVCRCCNGARHRGVMPKPQCFKTQAA